MKIIVHSGASLALTALELSNNPGTGVTGKVLVVDESGKVVEEDPSTSTHEIKDTVIFGGSPLEVASLILALGSMDIASSRSSLKFTRGDDLAETLALAPVIKKSKGERQAGWESSQRRVREQSKMLTKAQINMQPRYRRR